MAIEAMGSVAGPLNRLIGAGSLVGLGDGELLERFLADRDEEAFAAVVARHGPMVLRVCRGVLRNRCDAEDAFQATFLILVRRARSLRGREDVGGWLHRVAYRVSIQANADVARRRERERTAGELAPAAMSVPAEVDEVTSAVHEELARLPEAVRSALLLCELRGVPQPEAAAALRTSERTLRRRLVQGRERLRARLARRGLAGGEATWAALRLPEGRDIVSPAWREATARAALAMLGPPASGSAASAAMRLAEEVPRARLATRAMVAMACVVGVVMTAWAASPSRGGQGRSSVLPEDRRKDSAPAMPPLPYDGAIEVKGRVVDPDGKAVAGADVRASWGYLGTQPVPAARTEADGRFLVKAPWPRANRESGAAAPLMLAASAPGFGPGWVKAEVRPGAPGSPEIRLVRDGPPIEGRILDRAGRPVAGATVKVESIWYGAGGGLFDRVETGDLGPWLRDIRSPEPGKDDMLHAISGGDPRLQPIDLPAACIKTVVTDADGRFRLAGIGRERVATLRVSGTAIVTTSIPAMCRDEADIPIKDHFLLVEPGPLVHGRRFEQAVGPSRPIEGTLRDARTGRPVQGTSMYVYVIGPDGWEIAAAEATTDDRGRYRLEGLPERGEYNLDIRQGKGLPFPSTRVKVTADSAAKGPNAFDIAVTPGVIVRGRVTEKGTGNPARATISAYTLRENPHLARYPGFGSHGVEYAEVREDGRFEVVALPGPGIIAYSAASERYDVPHEKGPIPATVPQIGQEGYAGVRVDLDPNAPPPVLNFEITPRPLLQIQAIDLDGRPVSGARMWGPGSWDPTPEQDSSTFEILPRADKIRGRATVVHEGRKLIGSVELKPDQVGIVTLRLTPWGAITGRIVDEDGQPGGSLSLRCMPDAFDPNHYDSALLVQVVEGDVLRKGHFPGRIKADAAGRFRVEGIVPGAKYQVLVHGVGESPMLEIDRDFEDVRPGEVKDLGDFVVQARRTRGIAPQKGAVR